VRVAESLQGGDRQRRGLTTATIDHQWDIGSGSHTRNLRGQPVRRTPLRARDVCLTKLSAFTRIDQTEVFAGVQSRFEVFRGDKRHRWRWRAVDGHGMLLGKVLLLLSVAQRLLAVLQWGSLLVCDFLHSLPIREGGITSACVSAHWC